MFDVPMQGTSTAVRHYDRTNNRRHIAAALHEDFLEMEADYDELAQYFAGNDDFEGSIMRTGSRDYDVDSDPSYESCDGEYYEPFYGEFDYY